MEYLKTVDFQFGVRIHGAMLGILAGTPSVVIPFEQRTRELAEYHGIPMIDPKRIDKESSLRDFYEDVDFSMLQKCQNENFQRWEKIFSVNGLEAIFSDFHLDHLIPKEYPDDFIGSLNSSSIFEQISRMVTIFSYRVRNKLMRMVH